MSRAFWFALGGATAYYVFVVKRFRFIVTAPAPLEGLAAPWASIYPEGSPKDCYAIAKGAGGRQCFDRCKQTFAPPMYCVED